MFRVLGAELMKLKHTRIVWLVLVGALPSCLLSLMAFFPVVTPAGIPAGFDLKEMFYRQGQTLVMLGAPLFALMTGYILSREYQERTINQLFSYPVSRVRFLMTKLLVVFLLIAAITALSFTFVVASALLVKHHIDVASLWAGLRMNLLVCVLSFGTIPVAAALAMVAKNIIPVAVLTVFVTTVTVVSVIGHGKASILFPWTVPYWPVRELATGIADNAGPNPYAVPALIVLVITFTVSLVFCIVYYARADVHSGS